MNTASPTCILPKDATPVAYRVRDAISSKTIRKKDSGETLGKITLSFGIAVHKADDTMESLTDRADKAMYRAKHSGKIRFPRTENLRHCLKHGNLIASAP